MAYMLDANNLPEEHPRNPADERWAEMRSAYAEYMRTSEALGRFSEIADDSCPVEDGDMLRLAGEQRVAFERYLETRMRFLECRFDDVQSARARIVGSPTRLSLRSSVTTLPALVRIVTLGILSISVLAFVRSQHEVRTLKMEQAGISATLDKTRGDLQLLARKLDDGRLTAPPAIHQPDPAPNPPAPVLPVTKPKATTNKGWRRIPQQPTSHMSRQFSLVRSRHFKQIGPIEVSLISVDERQGSVNLSIGSGSGSLHFSHVRPNQPLWIPTGDRRRRVELIIDHIAKDGVDGRLIGLDG
jgi:hypothetical protein